MEVKKWLAELPDIAKQIIAVGAIVAAIAVVGVIVTYQKGEEPAGTVKQNMIPMTVDDFKDEPNLQGAIQKQLQAQPDNQQPTTNILQQTANGSELR